MRQKFTISGVTVSGHKHSDSMVTFPKNVFRRLLSERKLRVHMDYDIEHDGAGDRDSYNRDVADPASLLRIFDALFGGARRPWLLYYNPQDGRVHYCPHSNMSYTLAPVEEK